MPRKMPAAVIMERQKRILSEFMAISMALAQGRLIWVLMPPPRAAGAGAAVAGGD